MVYGCYNTLGYNCYVPQALFLSNLSTHVVNILNLQPTVAIPPALPSKSEPTVNYPVYVGKYDYDSQRDGGLSFKKGDLIYIISTDEGDWWFARLKDSKEEGYVPNNYLAEIGSLFTEE